MAPNCPEEIDVFSIPHSRMKELVQKYLSMVSEINFADISHLTNLLENLVNTFKEFKAHEQIENKYIMKKLKNKLKKLSIRNTAICNCHSDNRLTDMLELVQDGYKCTEKTEMDRTNFGTKLRKALDEFTEKFIPHMEEEEEVFQPMLIKYFTFEELRAIKNKVLEKHFWQSDSYEKEKLLESFEIALSDSSDEDLEKLEPSKDSHVTSSQLTTKYSHVIERVPDELTLKIFSYLSPQDLGRCAQVCYRWNKLAMDTSLWRSFLPVQWAKGDWSFTCNIDVEKEEHNLLQNQEEREMIFYDEDADIDESEECSDTKIIQQMKRETSLLTSMMKHLLPRVGQGVRTINLAFSQGLVNTLLYKILMLCPDVETLDLTHTRISDSGFKSVGKNGCGSNLKKIDLTGCKNITDLTLQRLATALHTKVLQESETKCVLEEKNEIEPNEKGANSNFYTCHDMCKKVDNVGTQRDIEDHQHRGKSAVKDNAKTNTQTFGNMQSTDYNSNTREISELTINHGECSYQDLTYQCCCQAAIYSESQCNETGIYQPQKCDYGLDTCDNLVCGLEHLSLSGCSQVTDKGLRSLVAGKHTFPELRFLDLSGCDKVTSGGVRDIVTVCPLLDHQFLYYCDNLTEDPYFNTASGCQNLECPIRACCRTGT